MDTDKEFLFLDVETGGVDPFRNSLFQIGLVAYVNGEVIDKMEIDIKEEIYNVTSSALKFNGLNLTEIYENGLEPNKALISVVQFIKKNFKDKPILVGHNPSIDKYMLRELFIKNYLNMDDFISYRMIDTMSLIWGLHLSGKLPTEACSSSGSFKYFNIIVGKRHHALDDSLATVTLFEKLIEMI